jgi:hypothetical protein
MQALRAAPDPAQALRKPGLRLGRAGAYRVSVVRCAGATPPCRRAGAWWGGVDRRSKQGVRGSHGRSCGRPERRVAAL